MKEGLPLPDPGTKCMSPVSPALAGEFFTSEPPGKPQLHCNCRPAAGTVHALDFNPVWICRNEGDEAGWVLQLVVLVASSTIKQNWHRGYLSLPCFKMFKALSHSTSFVPLTAIYDIPISQMRRLRSGCCSDLPSSLVSKGFIAQRQPLSCSLPRESQDLSWVLLSHPWSGLWAGESQPQAPPLAGPTASVRGAEAGGGCFLPSLPLLGCRPCLSGLPKGALSKLAEFYTLRGNGHHCVTSASPEDRDRTGSCACQPWEQDCV